jgi:hypothetical protein
MRSLRCRGSAPIFFISKFRTRLINVIIGAQEVCVEEIHGHCRPRDGRTQADGRTSGGRSRVGFKEERKRSATTMEARRDARNDS